LPPLRHHSANSISPFELPHADNLEYSASSVDFGHSSEINFNLNPGEPSTPSRNDQNSRNGKKSANVTDGNPAKKSAHFGDTNTKKHDGKKSKLQASDIPARLPWNKSIPKIAADFIKPLFVCIHTGDPRYKYDASVDNVLGPVPGVGVMAKRSQGWVKCEDRLPYYRDSSCSLPLPRLHVSTTTTPRLARTSRRGRGRPG
jgi:hypothetical protein